MDKDRIKELQGTLDSQRVDVEYSFKFAEEIGVRLNGARNLHYLVGRDFSSPEQAKEHLALLGQELATLHQAVTEYLVMGVKRRRARAQGMDAPIGKPVA